MIPFSEVRIQRKRNKKDLALIVKYDVSERHPCENFY
jgi:hypothetical protein